MSTLVLAIGNPILGDDAAGPAIADRLRGSVPERLFDGGVAGLELVPEIVGLDRLLVLDAVAGEIPGEVVVLRDGEVPARLRTALSPHQLGLIDLLGLAALSGGAPRHVTVVGVVAGTVELGVGLTEPVAGAIDAAARTAREILRQWRES